MKLQILLMITIPFASSAYSVEMVTGQYRISNLMVDGASRPSNSALADSTYVRLEQMPSLGNCRADYFHTKNEGSALVSTILAAYMAQKPIMLVVETDPQFMVNGTCLIVEAYL